MKIVLAAINAKYIHSNLAVYSLKAYAQAHGYQVELAEHTINEPVDVLLRELYLRKPDVLCFSCYIWNVSLVSRLARELRKLLPKTALWAGGPEVSYESETFLKENPAFTGVMRGEGEETFRELCGYYIDENGSLSDVAGLVYRNHQGTIAAARQRMPMSMDDLPFCYGDLDSFANRIIYYESSRGCPFSCSYCLSSVDKCLRFRSFELVEKELTFFLEHKVPQVKFVDRTFNCDHRHALAIWQFIKDHDNGVTNFHFEIAGDLLTEEELCLLEEMRPGLIQLEIGVQSVNPVTLTEIHRTMDLPKLEQKVDRIAGTGRIHQHLDLIAGLPFEDYASFQNSFDRIYKRKPQQLQLGFLKVLKGSEMYQRAEEYGVLYQSCPPYEVLATNWLSYDQLLSIKLVEEMLEVYYNSGQFPVTIQLLEQGWNSAFQLFLDLGEFYRDRGLLRMNHTRLRRGELLLEFAENQIALDVLTEALTFDLYVREQCKKRPGWAPDQTAYREFRRKLCPPGRYVHLEPFHYDFRAWLAGGVCGFEMPIRREAQFYLFDYEDRDPLTGCARVSLIEQQWED